MSNLIEIQTQIEKLTKQASEIRAREFDKTVQDIRAKMSAFGITLKDLQPGKPAKGRARKSAAPVAGKKPRAKATGKKAGTVVAAKFRGPNGEVWTGRGLMPRWLSALVAQGKTKEDFAIKS